MQRQSVVNDRWRGLSIKGGVRRFDGLAFRCDWAVLVGCAELDQTRARKAKLESRALAGLDPRCPSPRRGGITRGLSEPIGPPDTQERQE